MYVIIISWPGKYKFALNVEIISLFLIQTEDYDVKNNFKENT